jgi:hypothetical protein
MVKGAKNASKLEHKNINDPKSLTIDLKKYILIRPEPGVSISTGVAKPNVKAKVGENVAEALLWRTHDEVSGGSQEAVLQENNSWWTFAIGGGWVC